MSIQYSARPWCGCRPRAGPARGVRSRAAGARSPRARCARSRAPRPECARDFGQRVTRQAGEAFVDPDDAVPDVGEDAVAGALRRGGEVPVSSACARDGRAAGAALRTNGSSTASARQPSSASISSAHSRFDSTARRLRASAWICISAASASMSRRKASASACRPRAIGGIMSASTWGQERGGLPERLLLHRDAVDQRVQRADLDLARGAWRSINSPMRLATDRMAVCGCCSSARCGWALRGVNAASAARRRCAGSACAGGRPA